jgi:hypothetical protein
MHHSRGIEIFGDVLGEIACCGSLFSIHTFDRHALVVGAGLVSELFEPALHDSSG